MATLIMLEDIAALEQVMAESNEKPVLIFKHSAT
jgi:hypothetical protein